MTRYKTRFRFFAPRFFALTLGSSLILASLRWMLTIKSEVVRFKPILWHALLPALAGIICWYFMRPMIDNLALKTQEKNARDYFLWVPIITTVLLCFFSQNFITDSQATLTTIKTAEEISNHDKATFFKIQQYDVAEVYVSDVTTFSSGKRLSKNTSATAYFLFPMIGKIQSGHNDFQYWYALEFSRSLGDVSDEIATKRAQAFLKECTEELRDFDFTRARFFERLPDSDQRDRYLSMLSMKVPNISGKEILLAHTKAFDPNDFTHAILATVSFLLGTAMFFIGLNFVELKPGVS